MSIIIAGGNRLALDHLLEAVAASFDGTVECVGDIDDAVTAVSATNACGLILMDYDLALGQSDLRCLRGRLPKCAMLAIYGAPATAEEAMRLLQSGYDGYLPRSMTASAIICAVQLILRGERFVPSVALNAHYQANPGVHLSGCGLSPRQQQVLAMVATGASNKHIARALAVEEVTVKSHVKAIFRKLDVQSRTEAARFAYNANSPNVSLVN